MGSHKTSLCGLAFFKSCADRLPSGVFQELGYLPWMASPNLSLLVQSGELATDMVKIEGGPLDFRSSYLSNIGHFLSESTLRQIIKGPHNHHKVFDAVKSRPNSVKIYARAMSLTERWDSWQKHLFDVIVKSVVPICLANDQSETGHAFSDHHFLGAIFTSVDYRSPFPDLTLNISFAHELGHQALMIYQHSGDLFFSSDIWVYSGVRKTNRPIISALHGASALAYMIEAIRALLRFEFDTARIAYLKSDLDDYRTSLEMGIEALEPHQKSSLCQGIIDDLKLSLE